MFTQWSVCYAKVTKNWWAMSFIRTGDIWMWNKKHENYEKYWTGRCLCMSLYLIINSAACRSARSPAALVHQTHNKPHHLLLFCFSQRHIQQSISTWVWRIMHHFLSPASLTTAPATGAHTPVPGCVFFTSCCQVRNLFQNLNSCLIPSPTSSSCLQAVTDSCPDLDVITTAWPLEMIRLLKNIHKSHFSSRVWI